MEKPKESTSEGNKSENPANKSKNPGGGLDASPQIIPGETVTVYNTVINNNPNQIATGFNNALLGSSPDDSLVNPLTPNSSRRHIIPSQSFAERIYDLGMIYQFGLMDQWHRTINGENHIPGKNGDWTEYENVITDAVNDILSINHLTTDNIYFEIWNEPNGSTFWPYTGQYSYENHFMDTWEHAHNAIKAINSAAKVSGPAFSVYFPDGIKGFLNEAQSRGVLPDLVSWHYPLAGLYDQVTNMNDFFNNNNMYFEGITIGEYLTPNSKIYRGNAAYCIAQMERASIDSVNDVGIKAAGIGPKPVDINNQGALDDLTTKLGNGGGDPRAPWWVYKKYADMDGSQTVQTITTNHGNHLEAYATIGTDYGQSSMGILLGTYSTKNNNDDNDQFEGSVGINIYELEPNYHYDYNIYRLKSNGLNKEEAPESIYGTVEAADSEGALYITFDWQKFNDCYYILLLGAF